MIKFCDDCAKRYGTQLRRFRIAAVLLLAAIIFLLTLIDSKKEDIKSAVTGIVKKPEPVVKEEPKDTTPVFQTIEVSDGSSRCPDYSYFDFNSKKCMAQVCPEYWFLNVQGYCA